MSADRLEHPAPTAGEGAGDARVDSAVERLEQLDGLPVHEQVEHYERIHADLQDVLSSFDEA